MALEGDMRSRHAAIWGAIDDLAAKTGRTPSALARVCGLDATAFNKSKRFLDNDLPRWPNAETIARVLDATGVTFADFGAFVDKLARGHELPIELKPAAPRRKRRLAA